MKLIRTTLAVVVALSLVTVGEAQASECETPTLAPSSETPTLVTIVDTEVGTPAFERLVEYASGGHRSLGIAIAQAHDWFGVCEYVGIGIGHGSGGNGFRPNFTLALWREGVDISLVRSAVYALIDASDNPVVTNGDCAISCDGTIDGVLPTTTTEAPTTTTTEAPAPVSESAPADEPAPVSEPVVSEPAPTPTTTTTTTVPAVESAGVSVSSAPTIAVATKPVVTTKRTVTKKPTPKKPVVKKPTVKKPTVKK
jgi:hypothetical protein